MKFPIIIPAFNEEDYLPSTLDSIQAATEHLRTRVNIEIIVVDNNSDDRTGAIASERGARNIHEPVQGIARARNFGAFHADGDALVYVDADQAGFLCQKPLSPKPGALSYLLTAPTRSSFRWIGRKAIRVELTVLGPDLGGHLGVTRVGARGRL